MSLEERKEIELAMETIMFNEIFKDIFGREVKKCTGMDFEDAYERVILQAFPKIEDTVERHVSFKHIFDSNSKRLGVYDCPDFSQKLITILDDRVQRGIEIIPGGNMGTDFDAQLRFAVLKFCRGDADSEFTNLQAEMNTSNSKEGNESAALTCDAHVCKDNEGIILKKHGDSAKDSSSSVDKSVTKDRK